MTVTARTTLQSALDNARAGQIADILAKMNLGTMMTPLKRTFTGLTGAASFDLTLIDGTGETVGTSNPKRLAALCVCTLRVTAATTATFVGVYVASDVGATMLTPATSSVVGVARISDDGKTLTFPVADVTAFIIEYIPRSATDMVAADSALDGAP